MAISLSTSMALSLLFFFASFRVSSLLLLLLLCALAFFSTPHILHVIWLHIIFVFSPFRFVSSNRSHFVAHSSKNPNSKSTALLELCFLIVARLYARSAHVSSPIVYTSYHIEVACRRKRCAAAVVVVVGVFFIRFDSIAWWISWCVRWTRVSRHWCTANKEMRVYLLYSRCVYDHCSSSRVKDRPSDVCVCVCICEWMQESVCVFITRGTKPNSIQKLLEMLTPTPHSAFIKICVFLLLPLFRFFAKAREHFVHNQCHSHAHSHSL